MKKTFKKYFIPHPENDHKPHFLREKSVLSVTFMVAILFVLSFVGNYTVRHNKYLASVQSAFLVDLANNDREASGLDKLALNDKLVTAAELKANDMSSKSYFAHTSPEGLTPWHWIDLAGYKYVYAGENLAVNFYNSRDVEQAWMNSPTHRDNILGRNYTEIGIATADGYYKGGKTTFVVQMFGSPKVLAAAPAAEQTVSPKSENTEPQTSDAEAVETQTENPGDTAVLGTETTNLPTPEDTAALPEEFAQTSDVSQNPADSYLYDSSTEVNTSLNQTDENPSPVPAESYTNWFQRLLVSPTDIVQSLYIVLAVIVIFALILKIFIEIRLQHPRNIIYGVLLLVIILAFMHLNTEMFAKQVLVVGAF